MSISLSRRTFLRHSGTLAATAALSSCLNLSKNERPPMKIFDARDFGALGNGTTLDTAAIQNAIDSAAAASSPSSRAQVLLRGKHTYLIGSLRLKSHIDFHLADDARLLVSTNPADYHAQGSVQAEGFAGSEAALIAHDAENLHLTGTGTIDGRSADFMDHYDPAGEWWVPKSFRPRLVVLTACKNLEIRNLHFLHAPIWTLHLIGCQKVLIDAVHIENQLDVPNCDGIDPDHCRDVEIKNCRILCGDDAIVIKTTRQPTDYGPCENIHVKDCILETQDAGLKIGTETTKDIRNISFERCTIKTSSRGLGIQLRDSGNVSNILFKDITFTSRYYADPWWGRGEAISLTAIPRTAGGPIGTLSDIRFQNIKGLAENSARIEGSAHSRIKNVTMDNVHLTLDRWTDPQKYKGALFDNRPTTFQPAIEPHNTPGIFLRHADTLTLTHCSVTWGKNLPNTFTHALEAQDTTHLTHENFQGTAAHPDRDPSIAIS